MPEKTPPNPPKKPTPKTVDNDKKKQHDALMDEFKKVHRKMFACQEITDKADKVKKEDHADNVVSTRDNILNNDYVYMPIFRM